MLVLSKEKSKFNGVVEANLTRFAPGAAITVRWSDGTVLAIAGADASGGTVASFRTPLVAFGTYCVEARDTTGRVAVDTLSVIPGSCSTRRSAP